MLSLCCSLDTTREQSHWTISWTTLKHITEPNTNSANQKTFLLSFLQWMDSRKPSSSFYGTLSSLYSPSQIEVLCNYIGCFEVIASFREAAKKISIAEHVEAPTLVDKLMNRPQIEEEAALVFDYWVHHLAECTPQHWKTLKSSAFIPHSVNKEWLQPSKVFLPTEKWRTSMEVS